jgi:hypothetical protein
VAASESAGGDARLDEPGTPVRDLPSTVEGELGARIPETWCSLCWQERFVRHDGVWMLAHRGPLDECTHGCHDQDALLPSVS